jgi:RimJ/RimL family protein N-acetyltransferase
MRRVFRRSGYVKEGHYRDGWPDPDGTVHDAVGYAILRRDWLSGTTTAVRWDDEPA